VPIGHSIITLGGEADRAGAGEAIMTTAAHVPHVLEKRDDFVSRSFHLLWVLVRTMLNLSYQHSPSIGATH
jgi:hypothetical protein